MEVLSKESEATISRFAEWLETVVGPDDILPPDVTGCRELSPEPHPNLPVLQAELGELALCS